MGNVRNIIAMVGTPDYIMYHELPNEDGTSITKRPFYFLESSKCTFPIPTNPEFGPVRYVTRPLSLIRDSSFKRMVMSKRGFLRSKAVNAVDDPDKVTAYAREHGAPLLVTTPENDHGFWFFDVGEDVVAVCSCVAGLTLDQAAMYTPVLNKECTRFDFVSPNVASLPELYRYLERKGCDLQHRIGPLYQ